MLFYQRKDFRSRDTPINSLETARSVLLENNKFLREVFTFDLHYLQAVWKMCRHCRQDNSPTTQGDAVKIATQVCTGATLRLIREYFISSYRCC